LKKSIKEIKKKRKRKFFVVVHKEKTGSSFAVMI